MPEGEDILNKVFYIPPESTYAAEQIGDRFVSDGLEPTDFNARPMYALAADLCEENAQVTEET